MIKKIILLGFMGSGKSTVGKILASHLNREFVDLDDYIESRESMSVEEIFNSKKKGGVFSSVGM